MRKSESLQMLDLLGLNTIDYYITSDKREATHYLAKHMGARRSMRTERGSEFLCPFYYNLPGEEILPKALQHIDEGYKLIFSPSLDSKDTVAFGSVALTDDLEDRIEYVWGPGLCRELDSHPGRISIPVKKGTTVPVPFLAMIPNGHSHTKLLNTVYRSVKNNCLDQGPCIAEWSYYPYPVGKKLENLIFWELRGYNK